MNYIRMIEAHERVLDVLDEASKNSASLWVNHTDQSALISSTPIPEHQEYRSVSRLS